MSTEPTRPSDGDEAPPPLLPFVTTTEHDGPHDRASYAAGWEMGTLVTVLELTQPALLSQVIRTDNAPQADLICMRYGYTATFQPLGEGRTEMTAHNDNTDNGPTCRLLALTGPDQS